MNSPPLLRHTSFVCLVVSALACDDGSKSSRGSTDDPGEIAVDIALVSVDAIADQRPRATFLASRQADATGVVLQYVWGFGDDTSTTSTEPTVAHDYLVEGTYEVSVALVGDSGQAADPLARTFVIELPQPPQASFATHISASLVDFDARASTGTALSYAWDFGDNSVSLDTALASHVYATSGTYTVDLVVTDASGATSTATHEVTTTALDVGRLNDTAISDCYHFDDDVRESCDSAPALALSPAQDGMTGRDAYAPNPHDGELGFSFTKLDIAGQPLLASATSWSCLRDNVTGLIWEAKTRDGGLHDASIGRTFLNYDDDGYGTIGDVAGFVPAVNAEGLCGANDWRLPTPNELLSLVSFGRTHRPTIDTTWFPNWTENNVRTSFQRQAVLFYIGALAPEARITGAFTVLVRGTSPDGTRFVASGDEVLDQLTKLVWRRCAAGMTWSGSQCVGSAIQLIHQDALLYAKTESTATSVAWRVPNVKELFSIIDFTRSHPAIDPIFQNLPSDPEIMWTATPGNLVYNGEILNGEGAWAVSFGEGDNAVRSRGEAWDVRLVRDAQ